MSRGGRPRKPGKREANGRIQRERTNASALSSAWVQGMRDRFGEHYGTALGRAYAAGLLGGDQQLARDRLDAGKCFARAYVRVIGGDYYRCALDRSPRGGCTDPRSDERLMRDQRWLLPVIGKLDASGHRRPVDALVSSAHVDHGPAWLDRLLAGETRSSDQLTLQAAVAGLDAIRLGAGQPQDCGKTSDTRLTIGELEASH